ncbi:Ger(x)C family spore germination protein [Paenibacillus sp. GCM10027628]|uniref:Ger(x)C family spore germination protein n=1 Tax=Paenibacillus sp. GCM10027628 TaxID=3273413 RepID=UPI0036454A8F
MKRPLCLIVILSSLVIFSGCVKPYILENLALSIIIGYDAIEKDRILTTTVLHKIDPLAKEKTQIVANTAYTSQGARISSNRELSKYLVGGQVRVVMYGKKLASGGIIDLADTLSRDPTLGDIIYLCVSDNKASDILTRRYPEVSNIGIYLYENIRQNSDLEELPSPSLHDFLRDYYSVGKDPIVPLLKRRGNEVAINGLALFRDDRMVHEVRPREGFLLKVLLGNKKTGSYELVVSSERLTKYMKHPGKDLKIAFVNRKSSRQIKLVQTSGPEFAMSISVLGDLQEISDAYSFNKHEAVVALEEEIGLKLAKEIERFIHDIQIHESDVVGFGEVYRSKVRNSHLTKEKWHAMFKDAKIKVNVKFTLRSTGVIE